MSSIIDSGEAKPKLFTGKRKTEFNIYDNKDPSLLETDDLRKETDENLPRPDNVRSGITSQLGIK
ncbi:MAG: hypothetical protein ACKO96_08280 [Flammeovirgaceae bacterium]